MHQTFGFESYPNREHRLAAFTEEMSDMLKRAKEKQNETPTSGNTLESYVYDAIRNQKMSPKQIQSLEDEAVRLLEEAGATDDEVTAFKGEFPDTVHAVIALWEVAGLISRENTVMVLRQGEVSRKSPDYNVDPNTRESIKQNYELDAEGGDTDKNLRQSLLDARNNMHAVMREVRSIGDEIKGTNIRGYVMNTGIRPGDRVVRAKRTKSYRDTPEWRQKQALMRHHRSYVQEYNTLNALHMERTGLKFAEWMKANGRYEELTDSFGRTPKMAQQAGKDLKAVYKAEADERKRQDDIIAEGIKNMQDPDFMRNWGNTAMFNADMKARENREKLKKEGYLGPEIPVSMSIAHGADAQRIVDEGGAYFDMTGKDIASEMGEYYFDPSNPEGTSVSLSNEQQAEWRQYAELRQMALYLGRDPDEVPLPGAKYDELRRKNMDADYAYIDEQLYGENYFDPAYREIRELFERRQKLYIDNKRVRDQAPIEFTMFRQWLQEMEGGARFSLNADYAFGMDREGPIAGGNGKERGPIQGARPGEFDTRTDSPEDWDITTDGRGRSGFSSFSREFEDENAGGFLSVIEQEQQVEREIAEKAIMEVFKQAMIMISDPKHMGFQNHGIEMSFDSEQEEGVKVRSVVTLQRGDEMRSIQILGVDPPIIANVFEGVDDRRLPVANNLRGKVIKKSSVLDDYEVRSDIVHFIVQTFELSNAERTAPEKTAMEKLYGRWNRLTKPDTFGQSIPRHRYEIAQYADVIHIVLGEGSIVTLDPKTLKFRNKSDKQILETAGIGIHAMPLPGSSSQRCVFDLYGNDYQIIGIANQGNFNARRVAMPRTAPPAGRG